MQYSPHYVDWIVKVPKRFLKKNKKKFSLIDLQSKIHMMVFEKSTFCIWILFIFSVHILYILFSEIMNKNVSNVTNISIRYSVSWRDQNSMPESENLSDIL